MSTTQKRISKTTVHSETWKSNVFLVLLRYSKPLPKPRFFKVHPSLKLRFFTAKKLSDEVSAWLSVVSKVKMVQLIPVPLHHPFKSSSSGTTRLSTSPKADNHVSTPPLSLLQGGCPSCHPTNSVKALRASHHLLLH